jgi:hypothetical protein
MAAVATVDTRKFIDCRESRNGHPCSLRLSGSEQEVITAALEHAVSAHGHRGSEELRAVLRSAIKEER